MDSPDRDLWSHMREVELWQACALSLGMDPDSLQLQDYGWLGVRGARDIFKSISFPSNAAQTMFEKRLRLAADNLADSPYFRMASRHKIRLSDFAVWAVNEMRWGDLPRELAALAVPPNKFDDATGTNERKRAQSPTQSGAAATQHITRTPNDKWTDAGLRTLLEESREPGMTQNKLGKKYGVTRQRISKLLAQAREKFGRHTPSLRETGIRHPTVKGKKY